MAEATTTRIYELQVKLAQESLATLKKLQGSTAEIEKGFKGATDAIKSMAGALGLALSVGGVVAFVKSVIDSTAALGDMAAATGSSVENLSRLQQIAKLSGTDLNSVADALDHLNVALNSNEKGSRAIGAGLKAIGLNIADLRKLDAADALKVIADALEKYEDNGNKAAAMTAILGDASRKTASFMHDLANETGTAAKVTKEQADQANELKKSIAKLQEAGGNLTSAFVIKWIPSLTRVADEMARAKKEGEGFFGILKAFTQLSPFDDLYKARKELGALNDEMRLTQQEINKEKAKGGKDSAAVIAGLEENLRRVDERMRIVHKQVGVLQGDLNAFGEPIEPKPPEKPKKTTDFKLPEPPKAAELSDFAKLMQSLDQIRASMSDSVSITPKYDEALRKLGATMTTLNAEEQLRGMAAVFQIAQDEKRNKADKDRTENLKKLSDALKQAETPVEEFFRKQKELYDLMALLPDKAFEITLALAEMTDEFVKSQKKTKEVTSDQAKLLESIADKVDGYAKSIADSLVNFASGAKDAKFSFTDFVNSVLKDLARMATQIILIEPLLNSLKTSVRDWLAPATPVDRLAKSLVVPSAQDISNAMIDVKPVNLNPNAKGGAFNSPSLARYSNGVYDTPQFFKFAQGGVFGEAGAEAIMPLSRGSDGSLGVDASGAGVMVNVYNESKAEVTTQTRTDINGKRVVELLVRDAVAAGFRSGAFDAVMGATYGLNRQGAR